MRARFSLNFSLWDNPIAWAPGPNIGLITPERQNIVIVDPKTGAERLMRATGVSGLIDPIHWSPGGTWAVADTEDAAEAGMWLLSADGRTERRLGGQEALGFSPDGRWIYGKARKSIVRVPVDGGAEEPWLTLDIPKSVCDISADARRIACLANAESDIFMLDHIDQLLPH